MSVGPRAPIVAVLTVLVGLLLAGTASAQTPAPAWTFTAVSEPTNLTPGNTTGNDRYLITATNLGGAPTNGTQITVTDSLPPSMTVNTAVGITGTDDAGNTVSCSGTTTVTCHDADSTALEPGQSIVITVPVNVPNTPGSVTNTATVSGGGAANATATDPTTISATPAGFGIQSFDGAVSNSDGSAATQAGSHPWAATTGFWLTTTLDSQGNVVPVGSIKDISVALPAGFVGDPVATPTCTQQELLSGFFSSCPLNSQVGVVRIVETGAVLNEPVYNMVPPAGAPAQFGFRVLSTAVFINANVRTGGDYGLTANLTDIPQGYTVLGTSLTFWGVPADPTHNSQRCQDDGLIFSGTCTTPNSFSGAPVIPFLTNPTSCQGPQTTTITADSWQQPGVFTSASFLSHDPQDNPVGATGCNALDFSPTISVQPTTLSADSPSGLSVDLHVPQSEAPDGLAEANLENTVLTLPPGTTVSPSAAQGLGACTPDEIGIDNASPPSCPDSAKVGTVEIDTPLLAAPLTGSVYLAQQNNNPFGSLLALYVVAEGQGLLVKLAGQITPDPNTGQLTATFDNNPQLPFSDFKLDFFGGPQGTLATPEACGSYTTTTSLTPWNGGPPAGPSDTFTINTGCVSGFSPTFTAGVTNLQAGAFTPFVLSFSRADTDQYLSSLSVTLPPGLLAKLAGVPLCSDPSGTGNCPPDSQVGTVETGAGPGPDPYFLPGQVYLTGPYEGAPYGLEVVVPAIAGPFNLGTVVVRQAIFINPTTAQVTVKSDPFPSILDGIPLRIKRIDVTLNRPDFIVNPTSCDPMQFTGQLTSTLGASVPLATHFQVTGCDQLPFSPQLHLALLGRHETTSGHHPTLIATLSDTGGANLSSAQVTLPLSLALDPLNSTHVCPYAVAQAVHGGPVGCPADTIVGTATATTPLLDQPLTGNVYLVQGIRYNAQGQAIRTLPTLLVPLRGQVAFDLRAATSVDGIGRLVNTFTGLPDTPLSSFQLTITGGRHGLLVVTGRGENICKAPQRSTAILGAQSGKSEDLNLTFATPCGRRGRARNRRHPGHDSAGGALAIKAASGQGLTSFGRGEAPA